MLERAVDHVRDRLEAAVRMPGRALRFAGCVFDLAHLIEVDERVELGEVDAGEGATYREALTFEPVRGRGQAADRAHPGGRWVRLRNAGQDGDIWDGDCRHDSILAWAAADCHVLPNESIMRLPQRRTAC